MYQMISDVSDSSPALSLLAGYAIGDDQARRIEVGNGLVGQCALDKQRILITKIPRSYAKVHSSLGTARPPLAWSIARSHTGQIASNQSFLRRGSDLFGWALIVIPLGALV